MSRSRTPRRLVLVAEHLVDDGVVTNSIFSFAAGAVDHDLRGAELVAPVDERDLAGERVRKSASSIAESPPPTTKMCLSRKKAPSHVAQ